MGSAPAHHLGTIIMKFLLVVALVVITAAVDAFVLPSYSSYLVDRPVPDHSVLVHDGLHLQPVQVPGVPAVFASPPIKRERRQAEDEKVLEDEPTGRQIDEEDEDEDGDVDPAYFGLPFGALSLNIGSAYGALALYRPGTPYGALG